MNDFPINSVTVGNAAIRRLLPKNYTVVQSIHSHAKDSSSEFEDSDEEPRHQPKNKLRENNHSFKKQNDQIMKPKVYKESLSPDMRYRTFKMPS